MSSAPGSASTPVKRACDSCHRRKVKCIGEGSKPCKNCVSAGLTCTYNAIPQKKGPKGSRAKVLSELRETQRLSQLAPGAQYDLTTRSVSPAAFARTSGLLSPEILELCTQYYFLNLYPMVPILHRERVQDTIMAMDDSIEGYCKMAALCAFVLLQPNVKLPTDVHYGKDFSAAALGHLLLEETIRVRKGYDYIENPTILTIYTAFFIFCSYFTLDRQNAAWSYLRQALTFSHIMGLHEEDTYRDDDPIDASCKRRMFWALFVAERSYAFKRHRPLSLYATIALPAVDDDATESVSLSGFIHLIKLYRPFDETFFGLWNRTRQGAVPAWLSQLQQQLSDALPTYLEGLETQQVDLRMSQAWLKTMVWQLAISHGFISSMASDETLTFRYPIQISKELVEMSQEFSQHAMEVHGIGLVEKLFDVACTLIDVMSCVPMSPSTFDNGPREYLNRMVAIISSLRGGQSRYLPLLQTKVSEVLPSLQLPIQQSLSQQSLSSARSELGRIELYTEPSASSSAPVSQAVSPYGTPPVLRQGSSGSSLHSLQFQDPTLTMTGHLSAGGAYPAFTATMAFQESSTTTSSFAGHSMYQTHLARGGGYG